MSKRNGIDYIILLSKLVCSSRLDWEEEEKRKLKDFFAKRSLLGRDWPPRKQWHGFTMALSWKKLDVLYARPYDVD